MCGVMNSYFVQSLTNTLCLDKITKGKMAYRRPIIMISAKYRQYCDDISGKKIISPIYRSISAF